MQAQFAEMKRRRQQKAATHCWRLAHSSSLILLKSRSTLSRIENQSTQLGLAGPWILKLIFLLQLFFTDPFLFLIVETFLH